VDKMYEKLPDILEDKFWESVDVVLPYTEESEPFHKKPFHGSVVDIPYVYLFVSVRDVFVFFCSKFAHLITSCYCYYFCKLFFRFHSTCRPEELFL